MEGEKIAYRLRAFVDGVEQERLVEIDTRGMMFVCGGAFEGLYDQVYFRVTKSGSGARIKTEAVRGADGSVRLESHFALADFLKMKDLFDYGMVPQFLARFDKVVVLNDLDRGVLEEILLHSIDSPFTRSRRYFAAIGIDLEIDAPAAALLAERAAMENRTGARALRDVFAEVVNPLEFDPEGEAIPGDGGRRKLSIDAARVKRSRR
jgi:ATP-dependent Clp protease ATP-binding subunit ClpX